MSERDSQQQDTAPAAVTSGLSVHNRSSFIRVRLCDRQTTVFLPFVANVDTGATLKEQLATLRGQRDVKLALFSMRPNKVPMDDNFVLNLHNVEQNSMWFCCPEDEYASTSVPAFGAAVR